MFPSVSRMFGGPPTALRVRLAYKTTQFDVDMDANATFGELRYEAKTLTGLPMDAFKLLFRGRERHDNDSLLMSGLKNGAIVHVVETLAYQDQVRAAQAGVQRSRQSASASVGSAPGAWNPAFPPPQQSPPPGQWNPEFPAPSGAAAREGPAPHQQQRQQQQPSPAQARGQDRREGLQAGRGAVRAAHAAAHASAPPQQPPDQARQVPIGPPPAPQPQSPPQPQQQPPAGPRPAPQPQQQPQAEPADPAPTLQQRLMGRVDVVQTELDSLALQVDDLAAGGPAPARSAAGAGASPEKQALVLAELLTRVLLTLDGIRPPDGAETPPEVRAARKAAVLRAQALVDRVEAAKAVAKAAAH